jgi:hypothetical protein
MSLQRSKCGGLGLGRRRRVWDGWALLRAVQHVEEELARATQHTAKLERTMEQLDVEHAKTKHAWLAELAEMRAALAELSPSPAVRVRRGRTASSASADGRAALQPAHYMGKVAAWQRALSGAEAERAGAAEHGRLVIGLVHAQHARGRAAVGDADAAGRLHARQRAGARRCRGPLQPTRRGTAAWRGARRAPDARGPPFVFVRSRGR